MQSEQTNKQITPSKNEFDSVFAEWKEKCSEVGVKRYKAEVGNLLLKTLFNMWIENFNSLSGIEDYRDSAVQTLTISSRDPKKQEKYEGWDIRVHQLFKSLMDERAIGNDLDKLKKKEYAKKIMEIPMFSPYSAFMEAWARHYYPKVITKYFGQDEEDLELQIKQKILKIHHFGSEEANLYHNTAGVFVSDEQLSGETWYIECKANEKNHAEPAWFRICRDCYPELFKGAEYE